MDLNSFSPQSDVVFKKYLYPITLVITFYSWRLNFYQNNLKDDISTKEDLNSFSLV